MNMLACKSNFLLRPIWKNAELRLDVKRGGLPTRPFAVHSPASPYCPMNVAVPSAIRTLGDLCGAIRSQLGPYPVGCQVFPVMFAELWHFVAPLLALNDVARWGF